jgi:hypothetical protein
VRSAPIIALCCGLLAAAALAQDGASGGSCSDERLRIAELERQLAACEPPPSGDWSRLRRGQSRADVLRILGEPGRIVAYAGFERWEYPDLRGGRVNFDDRGRAMGWRPPPAAAR